MIGKAQEHLYTNFNQAILNKQINTNYNGLKNHWKILYQLHSILYNGFPFSCIHNLPDVKISIKAD